MSGDDPRLSMGERAAVGRIAEALFGDTAEPVRCGRYEVIERIGAGAFGRVYRARDPELDREVALKLLSPTAHTDRVVSEARAMAAISHPNVVAVFDVGVVEHAREQQAYIAMQLVNGVDLRRWLQHRPPWPRVLDVLVQAGRGLAAAHRAGLVHGDFKPDNVLVDDGPVARVVDFGLARGLAEPTADDDERVDTTSPKLRGTPAYMAPELLEGQPADPSSDQFAYFASVYEALHGERPFDGDTPMSVARAIVAGERRLIDGSLPRAWRSAIARGLAADPKDRFPDMDAALTALRAGSSLRTLVGASVFVLAVGGASWLLAVDPAEPIDGCADLLPWNAHERDRGRSAYEASELPYAAQAWERVELRLDDWAAHWQANLDDACAGTSRVEHAARRPRVACLVEQRLAFGTIVEQFVAAAPETVRATAELAEALPDLAQCESGRWQAQPTLDRGAVAALVQQAQGRYLVGDYAGTRTLAAEAEARAGAIPDPQLAARAKGWAAIATLRDGDAASAREAARVAFEGSVAAGDSSFAALLALSLASAHGWDARDLETGQHWIREAETQLERAGRPPQLVARLHTVRAMHHQLRGDLDAAREDAAAAVRTLEAWDATSVGLVDGRANVGALAQLAGETRSAVQWLDAARAQGEAQLGRQHPTVGTIASNQVLPLIALGRYRDAEQRGSEALAILGGSDADVVLNLGIALQLQGRAEEARARFEDARRLVEARHGANDPRVAQVLVNVADLDARFGRLDDAVAEIKRARTLLEAALPEGHPARAVVYATESLVHRQRGEHAPAIERGAAAHAIAVAARDAGLQATVDLEYGEALRAGGDASAPAVLEAAVTLAADGHDPRLQARLELALALALGRADPRAESLVRSALDRYPADGDPIERDTLQAWLDGP